MNKIYFIFIGILIGLIWYRFGERYDQNKLEPKCWEKLHYYDKEKFPLYIVHLKSILAGILLILLGFIEYKYKNEIIIALGGSIIGLHLYQFYNEHIFITQRNNK